ncbi:lymphocyte antigen 75 isoform X3 [Callorhinchus milii]|uniref:lymphocyte antigen 75 isoform X3 n=1 Tax=Callorhinchus milii TaxID=7868 RepID=UPI001C3FCA01|nr:lymphocyte antigen 75 isoform X3 [Callorhinchus milii]
MDGWRHRPSAARALLCLLTALSGEVTVGISTGNGIFTIQHQNSKKCLDVKNNIMAMNKCDQLDSFQQWKWVSEHRLFNIGTKMCLGIDSNKFPQQLRMFQCDVKITALWWRCESSSVYGTAHHKLSVKKNSPTVSIDSDDLWTQGDSERHVCEQPYRDIYTTRGNSYGKPCVFPFKHEGNWYHDCVNEKGGGAQWCSTTIDYDMDKKWGNCLKPDSGCSHLWEAAEEGHACYQYNFHSLLSWKEARLSCQSQGGDLLSIANVTVQNYIVGQPDIPKALWIGLNQMNTAGGWQWADGTPVVFINWDSGIFGRSTIEDTSCATINTESQGRWQMNPCEVSLPYVCKKQLNESSLETIDPWQFSNTKCEAGWLPYNGFCYFMHKEKLSWDDARSSCKSKQSELMSLHSLADVELVVTKLHDGFEDEVWAGLRSNQSPALFEWSDGSIVTFTYWDQNEPNVPFNTSQHCVHYSGKLGRWKVKECSTKLSYICKKTGNIANDTGLSDAGCPQEKNWKRHGNFCYKLDPTEVTFESNCHLTIQNRFEQEFIESLIRKHTTENDKYFWTSLQDINKTGEYTWLPRGRRNEPVTYTNWNVYQPETAGGCAVLGSGKALGRWEVKNCKMFKAMSICKKSIGNTTEPDPSPPTGSCPPGWVTDTTLPFCYKIFHHERVISKRTWEEAEKFCQAFGGHLPSFSHNEEMSYLHKLLRTTITDERWFWVGLNKRNPNSRGSWEWSDNRPVSSLVLPNEFNEDYGIRECGAFQTKRQWWFHYIMREVEDTFDYYLVPFRCDIRLEWVCQIPKGTALKIPEWYVPDGESSHGLTVVINGNEYWFVNNVTLPYQEAELYCAQNESTLATITSRTAVKVIISQIQKEFPSFQNWWVKTIDHDSMGHFMRPYFGFYGMNSFRNRYRECPFINPFRRWFNGYNLQVHCYKSLPFICQKINTTALESGSFYPDQPGTPCTDDWIPFGDNCYNLVKPRLLTWEKASQYCSSLGGNLPTIANSLEQDFITSKLPGLQQALWLGLQISKKDSRYKWVTGRPVTYTNWIPLYDTFPNLIDIDFFEFPFEKQCTLMQNNPKTPFVGKWNRTNCEIKQHVVLCQKYREHFANDSANQPFNDTLSFLNHTYMIIKRNMTWEDALLECQKNGKELVSITETYHQAFLTTVVNTLGYPVWIGLYSQDDGLHFRWSDGRHVTHSHWSKGDSEPTDDCVYMDTNGFWKTLGCESPLQGAICHIQQKDESPEQPKVNTVRCPHKIHGALWIPFRNNCYAFQINAQNSPRFREDRIHSFCRNLDPSADVLNIRNEEENNFVTEQLIAHKYLFRWVWLSIEYDSFEKRLKWNDGSYVRYSNWRNGRPKLQNSPTLFLAAVLDMAGVWHLTNQQLFKIQFIVNSIIACKLENVFDPRDFQPLTETAVYENYNYKLLQKKLSWFEAMQQCRMAGYHLVSVYNVSQHLFLNNLVKSDGFPLWIGLYQPDEGPVFEWSDGRNTDYKPWEYKNLNTNGSCVYMDTKGIWTSKSCHDEVDGAICYASRSKNTSSNTRAETSNMCPQKDSKSTWIRFKDYCYGFDMGLYNWSVFTMKETELICQKLDASAAVLSIEDKEENDFVTRQIQEEHGIAGRVWLSISRGSEDNSLKWGDGSNLKFDNWINETAAILPGESCAAVSAISGKWILTNCSRSLGRLVCKTPIKPDNKVAAIVLSVIVSLLLLGGFLWIIYKNKWRWANPFGSVRYERSYNDFTDSDSTVMIRELKEFHD